MHSFNYPCSYVNRYSFNYPCPHKDLHVHTQHQTFSYARFYRMRMSMCSTTHTRALAVKTKAQQPSRELCDDTQQRLANEDPITTPPNTRAWRQQKSIFERSALEHSQGRCHYLPIDTPSAYQLACERPTSQSQHQMNRALL